MKGFLSHNGVQRQTAALAKPSEVDWIHAPSCPDCNSKLKELKG